MAWGGPNGQYYSDRSNPEFDDPVQGTSCLNCSLIAGLSALAWVNPTYLKGNILNTQNQIKFYNWAGRAQPWAFSANIWDSAAEFCHSSEGSELWPAYYEKAYASCELNTHGDPDRAAYISAIGQGASITALNRITLPLWSPFANWGGDFYTFLSNNNLLSNSSNYPAGITAPLTGSSRQVKFPILAAAANHTYSVLGTYTAANNGPTYIMLRNPKGNTVGASPGGELLGNPKWWVNYSTYAAGGNPSNPTWISINLANGVFGIKKENFGTYFQTYSKVTV
jgi:hypothetical protein